jgi:hypothetical protein
MLVPISRKWLNLMTKDCIIQLRSAISEHVFLHEARHWAFSGWSPPRGLIRTRLARAIAL